MLISYRFPEFMARLTFFIKGDGVFLYVDSVIRTSMNLSNKKSDLVWDRQASSMRIGRNDFKRRDNLKGFYVIHIVAL